MAKLLDRWGNPIEHKVLTTEVAAPTLGGVRSPISGYPADGLNPMRLAQILREADRGDPIRYLELAETIEERDPHFLGVLGTRKRSVSQIAITVESASDDPLDMHITDMVRDWLKRDELTEELFDILDCIGKGYSFTEIIWDTSEGQWMPKRLEWRDPRWFRFDQRDLATPMLIGEHGQEVPLPGAKFIHAVMRAKSGLALRSGLARVAAWGWMFKAFTQRDWAIFTQTYGQPLRVGKWGQGASEADKNTLFDAVANIAGDCAAIIPESMTIDFVESKTVGASSDLYLKRADWLDRQISKAVLGQTTSTDAISGGHAVSKEHREVQADIERADAIALAAILNRDLIRPWVQLEYGPQRRYPRLIIARPQHKDLKLIAESLNVLVPLGLRVEESEVRDTFGFSDPAPGARLLGHAKPPPPENTPPDPPETGPQDPPAPDAAQPSDPAPSLNGVSAIFKRGAARAGTKVALQQEGRSTGRSAPPAISDLIADQMESQLAPQVGEMMAAIEAMLTAAGSLEEFREMLLAGFPGIDADAFAEEFAQALIAAHAAGREATEEESSG